MQFKGGLVEEFTTKTNLIRKIIWLTKEYYRKIIPNGVTATGGFCYDQVMVKVVRLFIDTKLIIAEKIISQL